MNIEGAYSAWQVPVTTLGTASTVTFALAQSAEDSAGDVRLTALDSHPVLEGGRVLA